MLLLRWRLLRCWLLLLLLWLLPVSVKWLGRLLLLLLLHLFLLQLLRLLLLLLLLQCKLLMVRLQW